MKIKKIKKIIQAVLLTTAIAALSAMPSAAAVSSVLLIADYSGIEDQSFNYSAWQGVERLKKERGMDSGCIVPKPSESYDFVLRQAAEKKPSIIWATGFNFKKPLEQVAADYPQQLFAIIDGVCAENKQSKIISIVFRQEEAAFLAGYAAVMKSESGKIAIILGEDVPATRSFRDGYAAGIKYGAAKMHRQANLSVVVAGTFLDRDKGDKIAEKLYGEGHDVIFAAAGHVGLGAAEAAKRHRQMFIGVDIDQAYLAPDNVIASAVKNIAETVFDVTMRVQKEEKLDGKTLNLGLAEGGVDLKIAAKFFNESEKKALDSAKAEIISGKIKILP